MSSCVMCGQRGGTDYAGNKLSFHRFPFTWDDVLQKWTEFVRRGNTWTPTLNSRICSVHFHPTAFEELNSSNSRFRRLKDGAIPTIKQIALPVKPPKGNIFVQEKPRPADKVPMVLVPEETFRDLQNRVDELTEENKTLNNLLDEAQRNTRVLLRKLSKLSGSEPTQIKIEEETITGS